MLFDRIQDKFSPFTKTFKDTVVVCARLVWRMICTPGILNDFIAECQRLQCTTSYTEHQAKQLRLVFGEPLPAMFPRFGKGAPQHPQPDLLEPIKAVGGELGTVAWDTSLSGNFRLLFAQISTRRAA